MHPPQTVSAALELARAGRSATAIARELAVPRETVRDWLNGRVPRDPAARRSSFVLRPDNLPDVYAYLLGLYLGDGCLSVHPRGVFRLRITLDARYPAVVDSASRRSRRCVRGRA